VLGAVNDVSSAVKSITTGQQLRMDDLGLEEQQAAMERLRRQRSAATEADFQQFYVMGLVTPEEWALIKAGEKDGVPSWRTVYNWVAALIANAVAEGRMDERVATAGGMQAMCMEIRNAGGRVFTMMNTQLPFTYVHLVSFVCHVYLFVLATYMGFVLAIGIPGINWQIEVNDTERVAHWSGNLYSHGTQNGGKEGGGTLLNMLIFLIVAYANVIIQGLLSMHGLLENPFGTHPCKFPLRAYNIDHIRQTRAMLRDPHEREPGTIQRIFTPLSTSSIQASAPAASGGAGNGPSSSSAAQLDPGSEGERQSVGQLSDDGREKSIHFVQQKDSQMHTDVQAPSNNAGII
jgi:Bestrophin, RFP-TM, chloride channel